MQRLQPFEIQSYYPHMKPADIHIWEKFIRQEPGAFEQVEYDIPVGPTPDWLDDEADARSAKLGILYQKKIDVVAYKDDAIYLIEVKPFAGSSALGQLIGYKMLYTDDFKPEKRVEMCILTNQCQAGYRDIFIRNNIIVLETGVCVKCRHYPNRSAQS